MKNLMIPLAMLSLMACGGGSEELNDAEDADESAVVTSSESALTSELSDEVAQPMSAAPSELASAAATRVGSHLTPAGCLTTTVSGATVTYVFNDCTGPYGLVHVTGTVTAVYSRSSAGAVQAVITGSGVKVNKATVDLNSTVTATQSNGVKTANVVSNASGTGPRGNTLERNGAYTVVYDSTTQCITIDGTWTTRAGLRTASTVVSGYQRCKGACPAAGGSIVHTTARSNVITVTYSGGASASWATSGGRTGTVTLQCGS